MGVGSSGAAGPTSGRFSDPTGVSRPGTSAFGLTNVGGGRKLDTVGVASTTAGWVGVASTMKVAAGVASWIKGGKVGKSPGVIMGSGVAVAVLSGGGTMDD